MPFDKQKNQRKAFCFITFDSEQVVNELLKTPKQTISGKEVDVKKATPKPDNAAVGMGGGRGGGRNMRGGQRGGRGGKLKIKKLYIIYDLFSIIINIFKSEFSLRILIILN